MPTLARLAVLAASLLLATAPTAFGQGCIAPTSKLYGLGLDVNELCQTLTFTGAQDLLDRLDTGGLQSVNPGYTGTQVASLNIFFNSVPIFLTYPNTGFTGSGAQLTFSIPVLGENQVFNGANRDESEQLLEDYLKRSGVIGRIMKYQAANSPHSPISGPGGLIPTAVAGDFAEVFNTLPAKIEGEPGNVIGVGFQYTSLDVKDLKTKVTTLPFSYTIRNNIDPRRQLSISAPLTLSDTDGAKAYHFVPGVSYRLPLSDAWSIAPAVRLGIVGSEDLATLAGVISASVASTYVLRLEGFDIAIGNMLGYYTTTKIKSGDYSADPEISNTVLRNGVMFNQPVTIGDRPMSLEYSIIDTRYFGTDVFVDNTQEYAITVGTNRSAASARSFLRGGLSYLRGPETTGVSLNIGYWF